MPSPLGWAVRFAASPKGRKMIAQAVRTARSEEGRKLVAQARKVATSGEGRRLIEEAVRAGKTAAKGAKPAEKPPRPDSAHENPSAPKP